MAPPPRPGPVFSSSLYPPIPRASEDTPWALRQAALKKTARARKSGRYLGLRFSALMVGVSGALGVLLVNWFESPGLSQTTALRMLAYAAWMVELPVALELSRVPRQVIRKSGCASWLFRFALAAFVLGSVPWLAEPLSKAGVPVAAETLNLVALALALFVFLIGSFGREGAPELPRDANEPLAVRFQNWDFQRVWGLGEALLGMGIVAGLPGFIAGSIRALPSERAAWLSLLGDAFGFLFVLAVAGAFGLHAAERLWPRWPRLTFLLFLAVPWGLSWWFPEVPHPVGLFIDYFDVLLSRVTSSRHL